MKDLEDTKIRNELDQLTRMVKRLSEINLVRNTNKDPPPLLKKKIFFTYKFKSNKIIGPIKINKKLASSDDELVNFFIAYFISIFMRERLDNNLGMHVIYDLQNFNSK